MERNGQRVSGRPRGLRGGVAATTPLAPVGPTLAAPRAWGYRSAAFLLLLPKSPGRGANPRPGQQAAASGQRAEGRVARTRAGFPLAPLSMPPLTQTLSLLEAGLRPQRAPTAWKCSADWEAHFLDELTEAQRGRADFVLCPLPVRVIGSTLSPTPAQPHPDSPLTASVSPHQRTPGRYGPPLRLAPRVGW